MAVLAAVTAATAEPAAQKEPRKQLCNQGRAGVSELLAVGRFGWGGVLPPFSAAPQERSCTPPLISRRAACGTRGAGLSPEEENVCLFHYFFPPPKGADPPKTVNGLWFRSVCARLSYLIKYLRSLMGPSRSGPAG